MSALLAKPANDLAALNNVITALATKPNITMPNLTIDLVRPCKVPFMCGIQRNMGCCVSAKLLACKAAESTAQLLVSKGSKGGSLLFFVIHALVFPAC